MKSNRLINESSPYLQQHAHNPVDWYPWGEEAFEKAKTEDKPILVSIGYSTCHWCHVMERESFENETVAAFMNEHYVNIKVDREERPDVDAIYMEAVQLIQNGNGGWPLNCFLLPDGRPFFGGTYFPPKPAYQRASWVEVLRNLRQAFDNKRDEVEAQANKILNYIKQSQNHFASKINFSISPNFDIDNIKTAYASLEKSFDRVHGGFGGAPKFPGTMALRFCLNYFQAEGIGEAFEHVLFSLDKMCGGGIYDHLGGGFARYTVDAAWLVPHFEKMLYDNALIVGLLADVYKLKAKPLYQQRIEETFVWVEREMLSEEGGFYAALDADSEGVEGKFYVWDKSEIDAILGENSDLFCRYYNVTEEGNWEEKNILNTKLSKEVFAKTNNWSQEEANDFETVLEDCKKILLEKRAERIRPGLDDKILLDWNAMMITAYCKAYQALGNESYKMTALKALDFVLEKFRINEESLHLYHSYKEGKAKHHAFLDDYALLIQALLEAYSITQKSRYSELARAYTDFVCNEFLDHKDNLFFFTSAKQQDIILHKKSLYDSATPAGNSVMVHNLQRIGVLFDENSYREQAAKTLMVLIESIERYPRSFGNWANALFLEVYPLRTISVMGDEASTITKDLSAKLLFNTFVSTKEKEQESDQTNIIVCKDYTCHLPVQTVEEALALL